MRPSMCGDKDINMFTFLVVLTAQKPVAMFGSTGVMQCAAAMCDAR